VVASARLPSTNGTRIREWWEAKKRVSEGKRHPSQSSGQVFEVRSKIQNLKSKIQNRDGRRKKEPRPSYGRATNDQPSDQTPEAPAGAQRPHQAGRADRDGKPHGTMTTRRPRPTANAREAQVPEP